MSDDNPIPAFLLQCNYLEQPELPAVDMDAAWRAISNMSQDQEQVMKGVARRDNSHKPQMDYVLMFPKALQAVARVCEHGGRKYGKGNFKLGGKPNDEYYGCAMRHLFKAYEGQDFDDQSGGLHIAHAIWNLMALLELNWEGDVYDPALDNTVEDSS